MLVKKVFSHTAVARNVYLFLFLFSISVLGVSFYTEYYLGVKSCPLCFMQRVCAFFCAICCLVGYGFQRTIRSMLLMQIIFAGSGLFFALRQIWLQLQPVDIGGMCMPGLDQLIDYISWNTVIKSFLWGSTDCSEVVWSWFGVSMPIWSSVYFCIMIAGSFLVLWFFRRVFK